MFRRKPPQLSPAEELRLLYNHACDCTLANLACEEAGDIDNALRGCKSLHTLLLFKIDLLEKSSALFLDADASILSQIKQIRDENVKHLIRAQLCADEVKRRGALHSDLSLPAKSPVSSLNGARPLHLSMRLGSRSSVPTSSPAPRPMRRSLRPGHHPILASAAPSSATREAMGAAALAIHSMDNLPQAAKARRSLEGRTLSFPPKSDYQPWQDPFKDFDDLPAPNTRRHSHATSQSLLEPDLMDLSDGDDFIHTYYASLDPTLGKDDPTLLHNLSIAPKLPPSPSKPRQPPKNALLANTSPHLNSEPRYLSENTHAQVPAAQTAKPTYVYKKPMPLNTAKLMKNVSQPRIKRVATAPDSSSMNNKVKPVARTRTLTNINSSSKPANSSSKPANSFSKPASSSSKPANPRSVARKNAKSPDLDLNRAAPTPTKESSSNPFGVTDEEEEMIALIRGIDQNAARQILSDIVVKGDQVYWDDVVGLETAKNGLKEAVVYPFLRPDLFKGLREPARGMLLFGPPGTGKTMLARAVATESKSTFFSISLSSLTSKYLGELEKLVKALFLLARKLAPLIVFIDEIDSLLSARAEGEQDSSRRIKNEFLVQWSELLSAAAGRDTDMDVLRVLILGATNLPWSIDEAARRRFMRRQYIPLPEPETRRAQILRLLQHQNHTLTDADLDELTTLTNGFSGSDVTALAKDSAMGPLRLLGDLLLETATENIRAINLQDFKNSLVYIRPSVSQEGIEEYEKWAEKFGSSGA